MKKKNQMIYWLVFILILMGLSIATIVYFRAPKNLKIENPENTPQVNQPKNMIVK